MKKWKRVLLCVAALFLLSGCAGGGNEDGGVVDGKKEEETEAAAGNARGRFVEEDLTLPETVTNVLAMEKLADDRIALFDSTNGLYLSVNGGGSFSIKSIDVMEELQEKQVYVPYAAIGKDGSVLIACYKNRSGATVSDNSKEDGASFDNAEEDLEDYETECIYVDANGSEASRFILDESKGYVFCYTFLSDGRLLGGGDEGVDLIDKESGERSRLCDCKSTVHYIGELGESLYLVESEGIEIYNMAENKFEQDPVLEEFVEKLDADFSFDAGKPVIICPGDTQDSIYIASSEGLFRHVQKGNVMEEVIKGSLSSMGSPTCRMRGMAPVDKENFVFCYNGSDLKKYQYDSEIAAVPETMLTVYSLEENAAVREAINLFQQENPDAYLNYEIGISKGSGITDEDAIRNLNTLLLSGEGPDILILDGLPFASYRDKGILEDLSGEVSRMCENGDLYENIAKPFREENGTFAVPAFFTFYMLAGEDVKGVTDLPSLADEAERLRKENPEGRIIGSYRPKEVLTRLYDISSPSFMKADGSVDREQLTEYLTQAKRIWQVEEKDLDLETAEDYEVWEDYYAEYWGKEWYANVDSLSYMFGHSRLLFGKLRSIDMGEGYGDGYVIITSVFGQMGKDMDAAVLQGASGSVFVPGTLVGMNAAGEQKEAAKEFIGCMLSEPLQSKALGTGLPINAKAMQTILHQKEPSSVCGGYSKADENGDFMTVNLFWPEDKQTALLEDMIKSLDTPANTDAVIKNTVIEQGMEALKGSKSIDEAVGEIVNKIQIYLTE